MGYYRTPSEKTITANGNAQIDTAQYKFGTSSLLMDGSGDYLSSPDHADFDSTIHTFECFIRFNTLPVSQYAIYGHSDADYLGSGNRGGEMFSVIKTASIYYLRYITFNDNAGAPESYQVITSISIATGTWYHVAFERNTSTGAISIYFNGNRIGTGTDTNTNGYADVSADIVIGKLGDYAGLEFNGWFDEIRMSNIARYNSATYTVPATRFAADDNTTLLLHCEGADTSTTFTDSIGTEKVIVPNGNTQIDTAQFKIGSSSALFDGTTDWLDVIDHSDFTLGTSDFTMECWVRFNNLPASGTGALLFNQRDSSVNLWQFVLGNNTGTYFLQADVYLAGSPLHYSNVSGISVSTGVWYHIAFVRIGNVLRYYLDGVQQGSDKSFNITMPNVASSMRIGAYAIDFGQYFDGWLDEMRVSDVARYSGGFSPSTTAFARDDNTLLLIHAEGADTSTDFEDDSDFADILVVAETMTATFNFETPTIVLSSDIIISGEVMSATFNMLAPTINITGEVPPDIIITENYALSYSGGAGFNNFGFNNISFNSGAIPDATTFEMLVPTILITEATEITSIIYLFTSKARIRTFYTSNQTGRNKIFYTNNGLARDKVFYTKNRGNN